MKKMIAKLLVIVLSVCMLTACGDSAPDLTVVNEKYNQAADIFNEAAALVETNGWANDPASLKSHNELADAIDEIRKILEDPEQAKEIDVDEMSKQLDELIVVLNEYKEVVSQPLVYESGLDLTALIENYNEIEQLYTKVLEDANANGWTKNESFVEELNTVADTMDVTYKMIEDPSILEGGDLVQADVDEYVGILAEFIPILEDYKVMVAAPYSN